MAASKSFRGNTVLLFLLVAVIGLALYAVGVVSRGLYYVEAGKALELELRKGISAAELLESESLAPLREELKRREGEEANRSLKRFEELSLALQRGQLDEFRGILKSSRLAHQLNVKESQVQSWRSLAETESSESLAQLKTALNKAVVLKLMPELSRFDKSQYDFLQHLISTLPEIPSKETQDEQTTDR